MYVNSEFTDNKLVSVRMYYVYVFLSPSGRTPYDDLSMWEDYEYDDYLDQRALSDTDGNGNKVGLHNYLWAKPDNYCVPAFYHTALNPFLLVNGYYPESEAYITIVNGNIPQYSGVMITYCFSLRFSDGTYDTLIARMNIYGNAGSYGWEDLDVEDWYEDSGEDLDSKELQSVRWYVHRVEYGDGVEDAELTHKASMVIKRGTKYKFYSLTEDQETTVPGNIITTTDILNFNKSGTSKDDFHIYFAMEPTVTVYSAESETPTAFTFTWYWDVLYQNTPHLIDDLTLRLVSSGQDIASVNVYTTGATQSQYSGSKQVSLPISYSGASFSFEADLDQSNDDHPIINSPTNRLLSTTPVNTSLIFSDASSQTGSYSAQIVAVNRQDREGWTSNHSYYAYGVRTRSANIGGDEGNFPGNSNITEWGNAIYTTVSPGDVLYFYFDNYTSDVNYQEIRLYTGDNRDDEFYHSAGYILWSEFGDPEFEVTVPALSEWTGPAQQRTANFQITVEFIFE